LGAYGKVEANVYGPNVYGPNVYGPNVYGQDKTSLEHFVVADGATEFSLRQMGLYAAIDLL
jgi:hypothetical protein